MKSRILIINLVLCLPTGAAVASELGALTTEELIDTYVQDSIALSRENRVRQQEGIAAEKAEFLRRVTQPPSNLVVSPAPQQDIPDTAMFRPGVAEIPGLPFELDDSGQVGFEQLFGFDGQSLNFSVGNVPGLDMERLGDGINEGPIQMTPRPGGGFDFSITLPQQQ